jgi:hypothetical protein
MKNPDLARKDGPYAMWVILAGLGAMTAVTIGALVRYPDPTAIVTALGPVTGVIGTLVGAYFGLRGSSLAQQHANTAETARVEAASSPPPPPPPSNGHGDPALISPYPGPSDGNDVAAAELRTLQELAALDASSDAGGADDDLPDPEDAALDDAPDDEGDDREAHGVTP